MSIHVTYANRGTAIQREVVDLIEGSSLATDARAEFDIERIADEVILSRLDHGRAVYYFDASEDQFWDVVERNDRRVI